MRALTILLVLLAACGSVPDHAACGASTDCPAGEYCARTSDGNVCWPDAVPPTLSGVTVTCAADCLRDGVLHVEATVADDAEVLGAEVSLDVGGLPVALQRSGPVWTADLQLRKFPFDHFAHRIVATVTARDGARNEVSLDATSATTTTRLRWRTSLGAAVASPSVGPTGVLAVPTNNGRVHFMNWDGSYVGSVELAAGTPQDVTAPTLVGDSFWVGALDGNVYELSQSGGVWIATSRANTGGAVRASLASTSSGTVIAASESGGSGVVYAVTRSSSKNGPPVAGLPFGVGPVVDQLDAIFAVAVGSAHKYTLLAGFPTEDWTGPVALGGSVADPLACSTNLLALVNTGSAGLAKSVSPAGDPQTLVTTGLPSSGAVILEDESIVVPEQTKTLSRWTATGAVFPGWQRPDLGSAGRTPLVLTGSNPFIVSTTKGALHGLRTDGSIAWSGQLSAGTASLQPGNIYTPPGQPAGETLSTAYFAGSDGVLHAVIVDGQLDASAPWPKAFHDPRNTNRAGPQP
jgi:hypothetical protein